MSDQVKAVEFESGKYRIELQPTGGYKAFRNGEHWPVAEGSKLTGIMADEIARLRVNSSELDILNWLDKIFMSSGNKEKTDRLVLGLRDALTAEVALKSNSSEAEVGIKQSVQDVMPFLTELMDYNWSQEANDFRCEYDIDADLSDEDLAMNFEFDDNQKRHIFYRMVQICKFQKAHAKPANKPSMG